MLLLRLSKVALLVSDGAGKKDGGRYPAATPNPLLCGLNTIMLPLNPTTLNRHKETDQQLAGFRGRCDTVTRILREGVRDTSLMRKKQVVE